MINVLVDMWGEQDGKPYMIPLPSTRTTTNATATPST